MAEALRWYAALLLIGGAGLLPAGVLFARLHSRGLLYARPIAMLLVAQIVWLAAALTSLSYGTALVLAAVLALWAWSATLAWRRPALLRGLRERWRLLLGGEALFLALFLLLVVVRAQAPAATGTEKPMDLALLTAVHETSSFPPADPWLAGADIAYYHLGHTMVDAIGRLAGTPPAISFNMGVAAVGAMAAVAVFGLAGDVLALSRPKHRWARPLAGGIALLSFLILAPLEGLMEIAAANGLGGQSVWGRLGVEGLPGPAEATAGVPDAFFWWWNATRVLPGTITEFPAFSIILGDLHAHLLALPLGITALALAVVTFDGTTPLGWRRWLREPEALLLAGALFAGLAMTHSWDVVSYGGIWLLAAAAAYGGVGWPWHAALLGAVRHLALPAAVALLIAGPLLASLETPWIGIELVTSTGSDPVRFSIFWLPLALPLLVGVAAVATRPRRSVLLRVAVAAMLPVVAWAVAVVVSGDAAALLDRAEGWIVLLGLVATIAVFGAAAMAAYRPAARHPADRGGSAWLSMVVAGAVIILVTELVFIRDGWDAGRLNAVFKFWYAVWPLLAVAGSVGVALAVDRARRWRVPMPAAVVLLPMVLLWAGSLLYAPAATISRGREGQPRGLDGLAFLVERDIGAAGAIVWIDQTLGPQDVVLEAVGRDYGAGNFVSAATGVPTLLGWPAHEFQWRGEAAIAGLSEVVDRIYEAGAAPTTAELAGRYGITYIYIGREERAQYGPDVADRFDGWVVAFADSGVRIVVVPDVARSTGGESGGTR